MKRVRIFLRTELFALPNGRAISGGPPHVPQGVIIVDAVIRESDRTGLLIEATAYRDMQGRTIEGKPAVLILPTSKVDHMQVLEE
jgi:hypothetical protein